MRTDQVKEMYAPFAHTILLDYVNGSGFAHQLASLGKGDWQRVADAAPAGSPMADRLSSLRLVLQNRQQGGRVDHH